MESNPRARRLHTPSALSLCSALIALSLASCGKVGFPRVDEVAARLTGRPLLERYGSGRSSGTSATRPGRGRGRPGSPGTGEEAVNLPPNQISAIVTSCLGGEGAPRVSRHAVGSFDALYRLATPSAPVTDDPAAIATAAYYRGVREVARGLRSCLRRGNDIEKMRWGSFLEIHLPVEPRPNPPPL